MTDSRTTFLKRLNSALPPEQRRTLPLPTPSTDTDAISSMQQLTTQDYEQQVLKHLGTEYDHLWSVLLTPELIRKTYSVLLRKRATTIRQVSQPRTDNPRARQRENRMRAFLHLVDVRIQQVEELLDADPLVTQRAAIRTLTDEIRRHRTATLESGVEPEPWDKRLWSVLDKVRPGLES